MGFFQDIKDGFAELLYPKRCVVCDVPGTLLCQDCAAQINLVEQATACPNCACPNGAFLCTECIETHFPFSHAFAYAEYGKETERIIKTYKDAGEWGCSEIIDQGIAHCVQEGLAFNATNAACEYDALAFVPATPAAYRRRGFDHMEQVAKQVSARLDLPIAYALKRSDAKDQRSLGKQERLANSTASFFVKETNAARLLLIDDVFTTGATLNAASQCLLDAGIRYVDVAVFARVC